MKFIFVCPETGEIFECEAFSLTDHHGIQTDDTGNRYLDATVTLDLPCPICGAGHSYRARDLICPFNEKNERNKTNDET